MGDKLWRGKKKKKNQEMFQIEGEARRKTRQKGSTNLNWKLESTNTNRPKERQEKWVIEGKGKNKTEKQQ